MGGLFAKKEAVIGPNSKVGLDSNCQECGKFFSKNTTYHEMNSHKNTCIIEKRLKSRIAKDIKDIKDIQEEQNKVPERRQLNTGDVNPYSYNKSNSIYKSFSNSNSNADHTHNHNKIHINAHHIYNPNVNPVNHNKNKTGNLTKSTQVKPNNVHAFDIDPNRKSTSIQSNNTKKLKSNPVKAKEKEFKIEEAFDPMENIYKISKRDSCNLSSISNLNIAYIKDFPFEEKVIQFKKQLQMLKVDWRKGYCNLELDRESYLRQSIDQFNKIDPYKELHVNFKGEVSYDAGGIIREWFTIIFKELLKEEMKLFELSDSSDFSFRIHKDAEPSILNLDTFNFIGKIIAKALLENLTVNTSFNKLIYKMLLEEEVLIDDLVFIDRPLSRSLKELIKLPSVDDLGIYFVVQYESCGKLVQDELIPNGSNVPVNNDNVDEYVIKRIEHIQQKDKIFINEIKSGLYSLIPSNIVKIFTSDKFELLLNGQPFIDVYDWKAHSIYKDYSDTSTVVNNFWNIMFNLSQEELARFLQFCTGSSRVPLGGFGALESNRGNISKFCITQINWKPGHSNYIRAHTCFNRLDVPNFPSESSLREAVNYIIENEILGFGVD